MYEWTLQADKYDEIRNDGLWNKALQIAVIAELDHPFCAVRVREILKWGDTPQYRNFVENMKALGSGKKCSSCGNFVSPDWKFCKHCGQKLQ